MKSYWVEHKGKRVLVADYSHFGSDSVGLKEEASQLIDVIKKEHPNSLRVISNVEGTTASLGNAQVLMDVLPHTNPFVIKRCVVGATGIGWGFIESFNRLAGRAQIKPFRTMEDALDWIVQE